MVDNQETSEHAKALASIGAAKGGKVRAQRLSVEQRREIGRQGADERWGIPRATHTGSIEINGRTIFCCVLSDERRLLTQETFMTSIGRAPKAKGKTGSVRMTSSAGSADDLPPFLAENLRPFVTSRVLELAKPIVFRTAAGNKAFGYDARLLPMIGDVYLKARDAGAILPAQRHIVDVCDRLIRALAGVAMIALVDEATGYQEERDRNDLRKILKAYIHEELQPWIPRFSDEFFAQTYRLHSWEYRPGNAKRYPYVGKWINRVIYEQLPPGVLPKLQELNPVNDNGHRKHKHHQFLTEDTGNVHLDRQISSVTMLMRISNDKEQFEELFAKAFSKEPIQQRLPLVLEGPNPYHPTVN